MRGDIVAGDADHTISGPPIKHSTRPTDARYTPQPQADATSSTGTMLLWVTIFRHPAQGDTMARW
jgi:hypothetical protein